MKEKQLVCFVCNGAFQLFLAFMVTKIVNRIV